MRMNGNLAARLDLSRRSTLPEKMDDPSAPESEVRKALGELETINRWLGGYRLTLGALAGLASPGATLTILDVGSGGGDMLRRIARWGERRGLRLKLTGIDVNPKMTDYAASRTQGLWNEVRFRTLDIWDEGLAPGKYDVVINSLFCHHFDDDALVELVKRMVAIAGKAVVINDLHRHWFAYQSIRLITRILSRSELVRYDAPLSVARALKREEWERVLLAAGVADYTIEWKWAWRWRIVLYNRPRPSRER